MVSYVLIVRYKYYDLKYTKLVKKNQGDQRKTHSEHSIQIGAMSVAIMWSIFFLLLYYILGTTKLLEYKSNFFTEKKCLKLNLTKKWLGGYY